MREMSVSAGPAYEHITMVARDANCIWPERRAMVYLRSGTRPRLSTGGREWGGNQVMLPVRVRTANPPAGRGFPSVVVLVLLMLAPLLSACGFNTIPTADERAKAAWSEVLNQYQRRADLIPNLVETVKGYASHEREVLEAVVEARAKATQVAISPEMLENPAAFQAFQEGQAGLTGALSRLLAVVENYPDLKASQNFLALQAQLEGTENRIAVARRDYIEAVRVYNTSLRTLPSMLWAWLWFTDAKPYQNFTVAEDKMDVPSVSFGGGQGG